MGGRKVIYIVIIIFMLFLAIAVICFVLGWKNGRAKIEREIAQDAVRKEADRKFYENEKAKIKREVSQHAKDEKNNLAGFSNNRDKFDAINNKLRHKS
jgi:hypothetical protein